MARIQIVELPSQVVGEFVRTPFAIIIDKALVKGPRVGTDEPPVDEFDPETIKAEFGAAAVIVTSATLDAD